VTLTVVEAVALPSELWNRLMILIVPPDWLIVATEPAAAPRVEAGRNRERSATMLRVAGVPVPTPMRELTAELQASWGALEPEPKVRVPP